jgi:YbbR domain-containing protein
MCDISGITAESKNKMLSVSIEDTKEVDYDVAVEQTGTLNSNNYISSIDLDKTSIKISGSISKIDIIGNVIAYVDITDAYNGKKITVTPTILDKNGNEMDLSNFTLDVEELTATVHMYKTKTVPLTISVQNTNDSGEITSYSYDKSEIIIAADDDTLEETSGIFIEIPVTIEEDINTSDFIKVVSLKELLPQGVYMAENDSKLSIEISYEKYEERTIELTNDDVIFVNKDGDYQYSLEDPIKVKIRGKSAQLDELSLKGIIDVEEKTDGTYNFDVELDSKYVVGNYKAVVLVEEREE